MDIFLCLHIKGLLETREKKNRGTFLAKKMRQSFTYELSGLTRDR